MYFYINIYIILKINEKKKRKKSTIFSINIEIFHRIYFIF